MYNHILVALDGSKPSDYASQAAMAFAEVAGSRITTCHIYGAEYHRRRFSDMEPGLPAQYQDGPSLAYLRTAHDKLIHEGFHSLSAGYVERFLAACRHSGIDVESVAAEGRSYVGILQLADELKCDLIAVGADGLGATGNGLLGGTTTRILNSAPCDVLVARCPMNASGPILIGIDGSETALQAADRAVRIGRTAKRPVHMVAVYDPQFHTHVFGVMARSLSPETQAQIGLEGQEKLHDEIINDGLGKLYTGFLHNASQRFGENNVKLTQSLLTGKPYRALDAAARDCGADLVVVGRHGHHRQPYSRLGSNAESLIRTSGANVLLVGGIDEPLPQPKSATRTEKTTEPGPAPVWDAAAQERLKRVPSFVRMMARQMVENAVKNSGRESVLAEDFDAVAAQFGMMPKKDAK